MASSLTQILNNGKTALLGHQKALASTANNAANVSTPGYNRRTTNFDAQSYENGVKVSIHRRQTARYITDQILDQNSAHGAADAKSSSLSAVDRMFQEDEGNLGGAVDQFFTSIRELSVSPTDTDRRQATLSKAEQLAQTLSGTATRVEQERKAVDESLDTLISKANALTRELAKLNQDLSITPGKDAENGAVLDKQQTVLKELSELVPLHSFRDKQGHLTVLLGGGEPLVQGKESAQLNAVPDTSLDGLRRIDMIGISGVAINVTQQISSGKIGGTIDLRDHELSGLLDTLDQLAFDLSTQINTVHQAGFGLDGNSGRALFVDPPAGVSGAAKAMALHADLIDNPDALAAAQDTASAVGGNHQLLALLELQDQPLAASGKRTFAHEVAAMVGQAGQSVKDNEERLHQSLVAKEAAEGMEQAQVGISLDEEMIDLMRFQRAYQASSKVITTVDALYEIVMQLK